MSDRRGAILTTDRKPDREADDDLLVEAIAHIVAGHALRTLAAKSKRDGKEPEAAAEVDR